MVVALRVSLLGLQWMVRHWDSRWVQPSGLKLVSWWDLLMGAWLSAVPKEIWLELGSGGLLEPQWAYSFLLESRQGNYLYLGHSPFGKICTISWIPGRQSTSTPRVLTCHCDPPVLFVAHLNVFALVSVIQLQSLRPAEKSTAQPFPISTLRSSVSLSFAAALYRLSGCRLLDDNLLEAIVPAVRPC